MSRRLQYSQACFVFNISQPPINFLAKATKNTSHIPAMRGSARRRANSVNDFVINPTFTGSFRARTTCVGKCNYPQFQTGNETVFRATREAHSCSEPCAAPGICQIDTSPQSIEATFTGKHETFQYTRVSTDRIFATHI